MRVPDGMTPLKGYRAWYVGGSTGLLTGQAHTELWSPYQPFRAACYSGDTDSHLEKNGDYIPAPAIGCTCGVYSYKTMAQLTVRMNAIHEQTYGLAPLMVWGEVYLWGTIVEHDKGYRSEFAYPADLTTTKRELCAKVSRLYGVRCLYADPPKEIEYLDEMAAMAPAYYAQLQAYSRMFRQPRRLGVVTAISTPAPIITSSAALKSQMRHIYQQATVPFVAPSATPVIYMPTWAQIQTLGASRYQKRQMVAGLRGGKTLMVNAGAVKNWQEILKGMVYLHPKSVEETVDRMTVSGQV